MTTDRGGKHDYRTGHGSSTGNGTDGTGWIKDERAANSR